MENKKSTETQDKAGIAKFLLGFFKTRLGAIVLFAVLSTGFMAIGEATGNKTFMKVGEFFQDVLVAVQTVPMPAQPEAQPEEGGGLDELLGEPEETATE